MNLNCFIGKRRLLCGTNSATREVPMPPYAICSKSNCALLFDFKEEREAPPRLLPSSCPACQNSIIWFCPVCAWPLLTIPRQELPMCCNCWGRLRQDGALLGKNAVIRKMILFAMLNRTKLINDPDRKADIMLDATTQSCLLVADMCRTDSQLPPDMVIKPSSSDWCQPIGVKEKPSGTSFYMRPTEKSFPKNGHFIAYGAGHTRAKLADKLPKALRLVAAEIQGKL